MELPVATFGSGKPPTILFQSLEHVTDLHLAYLRSGAIVTRTEARGT